MRMVPPRRKSGRAVKPYLPYMMILPAMVGTFLFCIYPAVKVVQLSLFKYNLMNPKKTKFIGAANFVDLFSNGEFYRVLSNTALYTFFSVFFTMVLSILFAAWISDQKSIMNRITQSCLFTPHIISMVSIALVWMWMMDPRQGFLNYLLSVLGVPKSQWLSSSGLPWPALFS